MSDERAARVPRLRRLVLVLVDVLRGDEEHSPEQRGKGELGSVLCHWNVVVQKGLRTGLYGTGRRGGV